MSLGDEAEDDKVTIVRREACKQTNLDNSIYIGSSKNNKTCSFTDDTNARSSRNSGKAVFLW